MLALLKAPFDNPVFFGDRHAWGYRRGLYWAFGHRLKSPEAVPVLEELLRQEWLGMDEDAEIAWTLEQITGRRYHEHPIDPDDFHKE